MPFATETWRYTYIALRNSMKPKILEKSLTEQILDEMLARIKERPEFTNEIICNISNLIQAEEFKNPQKVSSAIEQPPDEIS